MDKRLIYGALCCSLLLAGGCSKKLNSFQSSFFTTDPTPLETVGQGVPAPSFGTFAEASGSPVMIQGEDVRDNGQTVSYKNGGNVMIPFRVEYQPGMAKSDLYLDFAVDQNASRDTLHSTSPSTRTASATHCPA